MSKVEMNLRQIEHIGRHAIRNIKFNLGNLENLNKIKVQTSMANGHFGFITMQQSNSSLKNNNS